MSNVKYVGLDVHKASTGIVGLDALGQLESHSKVKTKAENSCDCLRGLRGQVAVVFEEGPHAAGLQPRLKPLVAAGTVGDPRHNQLSAAGHKSADQDAAPLAQLLRSGVVKAVYKADDEQQALKELGRTYENLSE